MVSRRAMRSKVSQDDSGQQGTELFEGSCHAFQPDERPCQPFQHMNEPGTPRSFLMSLWWCTWTTVIYSRTLARHCRA
ncbi:UNVERIFIED_CONTAM: hypothetical protein Slati_4242300 [Sesamum latifolium]|uniref:Uncharacterized protein n=1 Tax=Sesamum latifolium TaxID=2727402 RepID=A0AAW2TCF6_9LAMI